MLKNIHNIKYPLILDGGLSNELEAQGHDLSHQLWSAKLIVTNPTAIIQAHLAYLNAGAQCIITSSYQASIQGFLDVGHDRVEAEQLLLKTVTLAEIAIEKYRAANKRKQKRLIAASIGPYGAYLADGSEYRGNYGITDADLEAFHWEQFQFLDKTNADLFACETVPSLQEAKVLSKLLRKVTKPAWISFSCKDEQYINDGIKIQEAVALFENHPNVFAIGVNCTAPKYISGLIKNIKLAAGDKEIIVYPNSGKVYDADTKTWHGTSNPAIFAEKAKEWVDLGADIIGGCCQIGPEHIRGIREYFC